MNLLKVRYVKIHWGRVYKVDFAPFFCVVNKACGRVYVQGGSYYYKNVCLFYCFCAPAEFRYSFSKPYNVWAELSSVGSKITNIELFVAYFIGWAVV